MSEYNGWTNWETWTVNMYYLGGYRKYIHENVRGNEELSSQADLANMFENYVEEKIAELSTDNAGLHAGFYRAGIQRVNWYELADHLLDTQREATEELLSDLVDNPEAEFCEVDLPAWLEGIDIVGMTPEEIAEWWNDLTNEEEI